MPEAGVAQDAHRLQRGVPFVHPHEVVGHGLPEGEAHGSDPMARALPHEVAGDFVDEKKKKPPLAQHHACPTRCRLPFGEEPHQATPAVLHHHGADVPGVHLGDRCPDGVVLSQQGHGRWILPRSLLVHHLLHGHVPEEHQVFVKGPGSPDRLTEILPRGRGCCGGTAPQGREPGRADEWCCLRGWEG